MDCEAEFIMVFRRSYYGLWNPRLFCKHLSQHDWPQNSQQFYFFKLLSQVPQFWLTIPGTGAIKEKILSFGSKLLTFCPILSSYFSFLNSPGIKSYKSSMSMILGRIVSATVVLLTGSIGFIIKESDRRGSSDSIEFFNCSYYVAVFHFSFSDLIAALFGSRSFKRFFALILFLAPIYLKVN